MKTYGGVEICIHVFFTSSLDGGELSFSRPGSFIPGVIVSGTNWTGDWLGPRVDLGAVKKTKISCPCRESNPVFPRVQPATHCYIE
jgi:hypothetical protein